MKQVKVELRSVVEVVMVVDVLELTKNSFGCLLKRRAFKIFNGMYLLYIV